MAREPRHERDEDGLTPTERAVLAALAAPPPPQQTDLARDLGISKQRISQITTALQLGGFLRRREVLVFTAKGERAHQNTRPTEED